MILSWRQANLLAFAGNTLVTYAVGSTDRFGKHVGAKSNKQISEKYPTLVTPAGWAFAIWGPIFLLEGASVVLPFFYQDDSSMQAASNLWQIGCVFQSGWTVAFALEQIALSSVVIVGLTGAIGATYASTVGSSFYLLGNFPYALHTAWLVAASIVNCNIALVASGASPKTQIQAAWASELLATVCGAALSVCFSEPTFAFVGAWALRAISRFDAPESVVKRVPHQQRLALRSFASSSAIGLGILGLALVVRGQLQ